MTVQRISLFKVKDEANIQPLIDAFKTLAETNEKDGKPYILELKASPSLAGDRGKGYTFVNMTRFKNMEDMEFYDKECPAHKKMKAFGYDKVEAPGEAPLTVFFEE